MNIRNLLERFLVSWIIETNWESNQSHFAAVSLFQQEQNYNIRINCQNLYLDIDQKCQLFRNLLQVHRWSCRQTCHNNGRSRFEKRIDFENDFFKILKSEIYLVEFLYH